MQISTEAVQAFLNWACARCCWQNPIQVQQCQRYLRSPGAGFLVDLGVGFGVGLGVGFDVGLGVGFVVGLRIGIRAGSAVGDYVGVF